MSTDLCGSAGSETVKRDMRLCAPGAALPTVALCSRPLFFQRMDAEEIAGYCPCRNFM